MTQRLGKLAHLIFLFSAVKYLLELVDCITTQIRETFLLGVYRRLEMTPQPCSVRPSAVAGLTCDLLFLHVCSGRLDHRKPFIVEWFSEVK